MKIRLIIVLLLVLGSAQKTVCAAAEEVQNREYFQEHRDMMKPVFKALAVYFTFQNEIRDKVKKTVHYDLVFAGKNCAADSHLVVSEQALRKAFSLCPSDPRKQKLVEFSGYYLDRAKLLAHEVDCLAHRIEKNSNAACLGHILQTCLTVKGNDPSLHSIAEGILSGEVSAEPAQREELQKRALRIEQQQTCLTLCKSNTKKVDQGECKECD